jgi:peptide-methionine (S)-S-oxide reductase
MLKATFAGGCFWGVEEAFRTLPGVVSTQVGFMGGRTEDPTYREVCAGDTGHAEVCEVTYDPENISYNELLDVFWECHDPTQLNRQGVDVGEQYRSAIFYHSTDQLAAAESSKAELEQSGRFPRPIVTQIVPAGTFYRAEEYHQQYVLKNGGGHCGV